MSKTLTEIAELLQASDKKVQLIYAFNGTGKTRLSREFKFKIDQDNGEFDDDQKHKLAMLYYNAFTEDLFYWSNEEEPKLKIQENAFTDWIISERGQDQNIIANFQRYTNNKLTPKFIEQTKQVSQNGRRVNISTFPEVEFTYERGTEHTPLIKISKGEESNFIWSVFFTLLEEVIEILKETDPVKREDNHFNALKYVYIDDPVSSLDENHLIEIAVDLVRLIKSANPNLKFIVSTHNPLFYNVFSNTFKRYEQDGKRSILKKYILKKIEFDLIDVKEPQESQFSYHLHLKEEIENAINDKALKKYHFNFLRNILEKTAIFLGHAKWQDILPEQYKDKLASYEERMINISSHSDYVGDETVELNDKAAIELSELLDAVNLTFNFNKAADGTHGKI